MATGGYGRNPVDVLDKTSLAAMNYNVVKRIDPFVDELLASAGHIVLYDYNIGTKLWTHKGVEGTLFLIKRRIQPNFQYIVLNKKSQDHHVEDIDSGFKYEMSEREGKTFLLYKNLKNQVVGIWFYDKAECDKVVTLLDQIGTMPPQATPRGTAVQDSISAVYPPTSNPQYARGAAQQIVPVQTAEGRSREEEAFWDAAVSGQVQPTSGRLLSKDGQRADLVTAGGDRPALDPLQRLFGGATANADRAVPQSHMQAPSTPLTDLPPLNLSATPGQPASTPRLGGLPPFRNASNGLPAPASTQGPKTSRQPPTTLPSTPPAATPPNPALPPLPQTTTAAVTTPFASRQSQAQSSATPSPLVSGKVTSLLKPSFFSASNAASSNLHGTGSNAASAAVPPSGEPTPNSQLKPSESQDPLLRLFGPKSDAIKVPSSSRSQQVAEAASPTQIVQNGSNRRARVREAVKALASSDAFVDLLTAELERSGAFQ